MIRWYVLVFLALAGCSPEAPPQPAPAKAKAADPDILPIYRVAVAPRGLELTDPRGGAAKPADFGLRQSLIIAILARSFGPAAEGHDTHCNRDFARWQNGLTLWFDGGDFSGWSLTDDAAAGVIGISAGMERAPKMAAGALCP
jgi:hypothetical protein